MSFVNGTLFWVMTLPLMLFTYLILTHNDHFLQIFDEKVLKRLTRDDDALPLVIRNFTMIVAIFFMILAMARPVINHGDRVVHLEGLSLIVALDISGSMRSQDIYPNRLAFSKKKITQLLDEMPNDDIGLVAFAHNSFVMAPFSSDKSTLKLLIDGVNDQYINMGSTNFDALASFSKDVLDDKTSKILVIFSDGGDAETLEKFSEIIAKEKISLYVVLVGTKEGATVINSYGKRVRQNGKLVISQRNDELGAVALNNNGAYVVAGSGSSDIQELVRLIKERHQSKDKGEIIIHDREELFYYPLALGLLLLLLSFSSLPKKSVKKEKSDA